MLLIQSLLFTLTGHFSIQMNELRYNGPTHNTPTLTSSLLLKTTCMSLFLFCQLINSKHPKKYQCLHQRKSEMLLFLICNLVCHTEVLSSVLTSILTIKRINPVVLRFSLQCYHEDFIQYCKNSILAPSFKLTYLKTSDHIGDVHAGVIRKQTVQFAVG